MVSYCNSLAMYRHQQQGPAPGWYGPPGAYQPPHSQQYLSCMQDAAADQGLSSWHHPHPHAHPPHPVFQAGDWSPTPSTADYMHHQHGLHGLHQHSLQNHLPDHTEPILPSPPMTVSGSDMSSPSGGTGTASPPQTSLQSSRPLPARSPFEWMKKPSYQSQPNPGKTRTKDKYRVVYSDHQRLELEKEFHYSRYITIRRKAELAASLGLSERQVKIWFQNRRAKERKQTKKREELDHKVKLEDLQHVHSHSAHHHPLLGHPGHHLHHQNQHSQHHHPGHSQHHHQPGSPSLHHPIMSVAAAAAAANAANSNSVGTGAAQSAAAVAAAAAAAATSGNNQGPGGGMSSSPNSASLM